MKEISLSKGKGVTLVDDADHEWLSAYKWFRHRRSDGNGYYARGYIGFIDGLPRFQSMHRMLLNPTGKTQVDHIDGNGLNNQRNNLRLCDTAQNQWNRKHRKNAGTHREPGRKMYMAHLMFRGEKIYLGTYAKQETAAKVRNQVARLLRGEFANQEMVEAVSA